MYHCWRIKVVFKTESFECENVIHILLHDTIIVNDVTWINLSVNYHSHERYIKFFYFPFHSLVHLCFMSILR